MSLIHQQHTFCHKISGKLVSSDGPELVHPQFCGLRDFFSKMLLLLSQFMATTDNFTPFTMKVKLEILKRLTSSDIIWTFTPISSHTN